MYVGPFVGGNRVGQICLSDLTSRKELGLGRFRISCNDACGQESFLARRIESRPGGGADAATVAGSLCRLFYDAPVFPAGEFDHRQFRFF